MRPRLKVVLPTYETRANSEDWIKELKEDLSPDLLPPESFDSNDELLTVCLGVGVIKTV